MVSGLKLKSELTDIWTGCLSSWYLVGLGDWLACLLPTSVEVSVHLQICNGPVETMGRRTIFDLVTRTLNILQISKKFCYLKHGILGAGASYPLPRTARYRLERYQYMNDISLQIKDIISIIIFIQRIF